MKRYAEVGTECRIPIAEKLGDIVIVVMGVSGSHSLSVQTRRACESITVPITKKDESPFRVL